MKTTLHALRRLAVAFAKELGRRIDRAGYAAGGFLAGVAFTSYLTWGACHR